MKSPYKYIYFFNPVPIEILDLKRGPLCTVHNKELAYLWDLLNACQDNLWLHDALSRWYLLSTTEQEIFKFGFASFVYCY